ncbi:MAG: hypothetical protein ED557_03770 [Balneola sp.]|nr:MAG: hypothetical protein ED557_03770 [Balneola sp.]
MHRLSILLLTVIFLNCTHGSTTPGVGESEKFIALAERMNEELFMSQKSTRFTDGKNSFVEFRVRSVESVFQGGISGASIKIPSFGIDEVFEFTEVLMLELEIRTVENPDVISIINTPFIAATKEQYYSESEFPIDELFYALEFLSSGSLSEFDDRIVFVDYLKNQFQWSSIIFSERINEENGVYKFSFSGGTFTFCENFRCDPFVTGIGNGELNASKLGEFPDF